MSSPHRTAELAPRVRPTARTASDQGPCAFPTARPWRSSGRAQQHLGKANATRHVGHDSQDGGGMRVRQADSTRRSGQLAVGVIAGAALAVPAAVAANDRDVIRKATAPARATGRSSRAPRTAVSRSSSRSTATATARPGTFASSKNGNCLPGQRTTHGPSGSFELAGSLTTARAARHRRPRSQPGRPARSAAARSRRTCNRATPRAAARTRLLRGRPLLQGRAFYAVTSVSASRSGSGVSVPPSATPRRA